jgi:hypothetical protein
MDLVCQLQLQLVGDRQETTQQLGLGALNPDQGKPSFLAPRNNSSLNWNSSSGVMSRSRRRSHVDVRAKRAGVEAVAVERHCQAFRGVLGVKVLICKPADPEAKGLIERFHDYLETSFLPGRTFAGPDDFNGQLSAWLPLANGRVKRSLGCAPTDRLGADLEAMLALPPVPPQVGWRFSTRLPRDHYVRLDGNDYSIHPSVIGRRIEVAAEPGPGVGHLRRKAGRRPRAGVGQAPDGQRPRAPDRREGLQRGRADLVKPVPDADVQVRDLASYDTALGIGGGSGRGSLMTATRTAKPTRDVTAEIAFLTRALKAPTLRESVARLADRARAESWTHEEFLAACPATRRSPPGSPTAVKAGSGGPVPGPQIPGGVRLRPRPRPQTRHHRPPGHPGLRHRQGERGLPRPPGTGKTHLATGLAIRACQAGHRVQFATAAEWVDRLAAAHHAGRLQDELVRLAATRCWSSTKSATSPSNPKPPTCSSNSSPPATNGPA